MLSHVRLFVTLWTVACQAPLSIGVLQARILEWVVMSFSRGSSQPWGSSPGLLHCRQILYLCKTQNSGLRSKEEKPRDPINQSSRCNTQEGLLSVALTGWLWSPGRQSTPNSKLGKLFICKKPYHQHITYGLQSDWLHVCKAILLVQTARAFVQT